MKTTLIVIETDQDLMEAQALVMRLMHSSDERATARLQAQARLIEAYEMRRWPPRPVKIADLLRYLMDQHTLSRADLAPILGSHSRVSEVLNGKKQLSMSMIQRLRARFGVPADLLIPEPPPSGRRKLAA